MKHMVSMSALPPSQYRKYVKGWNKGRYAEAFRIGGKDDKEAYRVYLPINQRASEQVPAPLSIAQAINALGWNIEDYRAGIAVDASGKRRMRIGRLLSKHPSLQKQFNEDKTRAGYKGKYIICISRHPYDIAGASTDRGWHSCMNIVDGSNRSYVESEIQIGSLVAYLIEENDHNIKHPAGRVMIKPFYREDDASHSGKPILVAERAVYGTNVHGFVQTVQRWLDIKINHHRVEGVYKIDSRSYDDGFDSHLVLNYDDHEEVKALLELKVDERGYFKQFDIQKRRLAFTSHPELLKRFDKVKLLDVRCAALSDPMMAYDFLTRHTDRIYEGNDSHTPIKKGDMDYRFESKQILNALPHLFKRVDHDIEMTDEEVGNFFLMNMVGAVSNIEPERMTPGIVNYVLRNVDRTKAIAVIKLLPDAMKSGDPVERLTLYPAMLMLEDDLTPEKLLAALNGAKSNWHQIISRCPPRNLTHDCVVALLNWIQEKSPHSDTELLRYAHLYLTDSTARTDATGDPVLIEQVLVKIEHAGFDLTKYYTVVDMLNLLPDERRPERFAQGSYFNALSAAFDHGTLHMTAEDCISSMRADDGVDFLKSSVQVIDSLWKYPKALEYAIDQLSAHQNLDWILEQRFCHVADKNIWSAFANRDPVFTLRLMRIMLSSSTVFGKLVAPYWFREHMDILRAFAEFRPQTLLSDNWFTLHLNDLPEEIQEVLKASRD